MPSVIDRDTAHGADGSTGWWVQHVGEKNNSFLAETLTKLRFFGTL
jgi:hypothetical protein